MATDERRIYGPPGTGKTSSLSTKYIPDALNKFGRDKVLVLSFTKNGAIELATKRSRETGTPIDIEESHIGTIHSICYHALGNPKIAETMTEAWNEVNKAEPIYPKNDTDDYNGIASGIKDSGGERARGEQLLRSVNIKRNRMIPEKTWQPSLRDFYKRWKEFKDELDCIDFTDMIELCLRDRPYAPDRPEVIFVDEAQDSSKLQLSLIRNWGQDAKWIVLVGDDDQAIFEWAGSTPDAMLQPEIPDENKIILKQSYRVPRAVFERANRLVHKIKTRQIKDYSPRRDPDGNIVEGRVREIAADFRSPEPVVADIKNKIAAGEDVMIMATCSFMLNPIIKLLRNAGISYHNRYRRKRGDWNPLATKGKEKISTKEMFMNFLNHGEDEKYWDVAQFVSWARYLRVGDDGLKRKYGKAGVDMLRQAVKENQDGLHTSRNFLSQLLSESACERAMARDTDWFFANMKNINQNITTYVHQVYKNYGLDGLKNEPLVSIGTIHSFKGSESSNVFLFPDMSLQADDEMHRTIEGRDAAYRVFYVACTRAREELILLSPAVKPMKGRPARLYMEL